MEEINIKELFKFFLSKLYLIVLITVLFAIGGFVYSKFIQTPLYKSTSTVILVSEKKENTNVNDLNMNKQLVSTYSEMIKNSTILNEAIKNLNLNTTIDKLGKNISVVAVENTEIIKITATDKNNKKAYDIANEVTTLFINKVNEVFKMQNVTILSKPKIEYKPFNIAVLKQTFIAMVLGLVLSLIIIFLIYYFDTTIKSTDDIEKTDLSVLGRVSLVNTKDNDGKNKEIHISSNPKSGFSESIKSIRANLQFSDFNDDKKIYTVTSTSPEEGKSFITANLAAAFAKEGKKVLIIDADLRRGRQHRIWGIKNNRKKGYSNMILQLNRKIFDINNYINKTGITNLSIITTGANPPSPTELLSSNNNKKLIEKLKNDFDYIFFDCPPTLGLSDALILSKLSDYNLVVVANKKTKLENLEEVKKEFDKANSKITGVILNKVASKKNSYYGYYGD